MAFAPTIVPKDVKKQQALDYALYEMASSYFKKVNEGYSTSKERMWLAWCENSKQNQYEAEDIVLALLENSLLNKECFNANQKDAKLKIEESKIGKHYAFRFTGEDFDFHIEINPKKGRKYEYELYVVDYKEDDL